MLFDACCQHPRAFAPLLKSIIKSGVLEVESLYDRSRRVTTLQHETVENRTLFEILITYRIDKSIDLTPFWQITKNASALIDIPNAPRASFVLNALQGQSFEKMRIPFTVIPGLLNSREEVLAFGQYLFKNPLFLKCS